MAVNPMDIMKLRDRFTKFQADHPKVLAFGQAAAGSIREGSVLEMSVTSPEGEKITTNMRVNADDVETLQMLMGMGR